jgi:hypothetical protein
MQMKELKPCHCGKLPVITRNAIIGAGFVVECDCGIKLFYSKEGYGFSTEKQAVETWNRYAQAVNEPLTLEQLRERIRKPVWIDGAYPNGWHICFGKRLRKRHGRAVINFGNGVFQFEDEYGKTWLAFRRPTEKSYDHAKSQNENKVMIY